MMNYYILNIDEELTIKLPLVKTKTFGYYSFNMMGMTKWNRIFGQKIFGLIRKYSHEKDINAIVTVESKAIGLAQVLAGLMDIDRYIILRKSKKSYMSNPIEFKSKTIISGDCSYWVESEDLSFLQRKNILVVDDVISTGGTIQAILNALNSVNITPKLIACAITEKTKWTQFESIPVISCGHIPVLEGDDYHD